MSYYSYTQLEVSVRDGELDLDEDISLFSGAVLSQTVEKEKSVSNNFVQKGQEDPPLAPPSLWQYISETAQTEDFLLGQEAVGTWPGWLRWMCVVRMRQKLPVAAVLQFPSPAWQLSIILLPIPVNYPNADWQAVCSTLIGKATHWTCSDYITSLPHTRNITGEHVCCM